MLEVLLGIFIILIGGIFALQGGIIMRIAFPFVGFVTGFSAGAGMVSSVTGDAFLGTLFGWLIGFFVAILFALLAYYYFAFAVVLAFAGFGASLAVALLSTFNLNWNWLVALISISFAILFAVVAISSRLPMTVLVVTSAFFGSTLVIYGLLLVLSIANFGDFSNGGIYEVIRNNFGTYMLWVTLAITGCITQFKMIALNTKMSKEYWDNSITFEELFLVEHSTKSKNKKK